MRRLVATRFGFFALAAAVCFALVLVIDRPFVWVAVGTGSLYVVLAVLFFFEELSRARDARSRH